MIDKNVDIAKKIIHLEFPDHTVCSDLTLMFIREFKLPVLIYFGITENDPEWANILEAASHYWEYLLPVFVPSSLKDRCSTFLRNFTGLKEKTGLYILSLNHKVAWHHLKNGSSPKHTRLFINHYIEGELWSY